MQNPADQTVHASSGDVPHFANGGSAPRPPEHHTANDTEIVRPPRTLGAGDANVTEDLRMVQGVINRLAGNSASAKTWCIAVVSGLLALAGSAHVPVLAIVAFIAVAVFGMTDAMYLAQERRYRTLFNAKVGKLRAEQFSADDLYDLNSGAITIFEVGSAIESWSIYPIYLVLLAVCLLVSVALSVH